MVVTAIAVALVSTAACSELDLVSLPPPSSTTPTTETTTTLIPPTGRLLGEVPGTTTTAPVPAEGRARLTGVVAGPGGGAGDATVRVEQLVGDEARVVDVSANGSGAWELAGIAGGRYRVRAFRVPDLIQTEAEVFFLADATERAVDLRVERVGGLQVEAAVAPDPPVVGRPANVVVQVTDVEVGTDGVAREQPASGVSLTLQGGSFDVVTEATVTTGSDGRGRWQVVCSEDGGSGLAVSLGAGPDASGDAVGIDAAPCRTVTTTTSTAPGPATPGPTTTSLPGDGAAGEDPDGVADEGGAGGNGGGQEGD